MLHSCVSAAKKKRGHVKWYSAKDHRLKDQKHKTSSVYHRIQPLPQLPYLRGLLFGVGQQIHLNANTLRRVPTEHLMLLDIILFC